MKTEEVTPAQIARECEEHLCSIRDTELERGHTLAQATQAMAEYLDATHCPTCGVVTDYDTVPHIALAECGRCARRRDVAVAHGRINAAVSFALTAGLVVTIMACVVMWAGR